MMGTFYAFKDCIEIVKDILPTNRPCLFQANALWKNMLDAQGRCLGQDFLKGV